MEQAGSATLDILMYVWFIFAKCQEVLGDSEEAVQVKQQKKEQHR